MRVGSVPKHFVQFNAAAATYCTSKEVEDEWNSVLWSSILLDREKDRGLASGVS